MLRKYEHVKIDIVSLQSADVLTSSVGGEMKDIGGGVTWDNAFNDWEQTPPHDRF